MWLFKDIRTLGTQAWSGLSTLNPKVQLISLVWTQPFCARARFTSCGWDTTCKGVSGVVHMCPNKEMGCWISISSSVLHDRCWCRKAGKMIIVGVSKVSKKSNQTSLSLDVFCTGAETCSNIHKYCLYSELFCVCIVGLQTNSLHTTSKLYFTCIIKFSCVAEPSS